MSIELVKYPNVRESPLYERLSSDGVRCGVCERKCLIPKDGTGFCRTRMNIEGKLYTVVYGDISSISANPIEKKPFFHFWPGSYALTIGTWSCNFTCPWCQNNEISKYAPNPLEARYVSPENFVLMTLKSNCQGTSISFNEPTLLFEYSLDVFPIAKKRGLYNTYVSNGYMTKKTLQMLKDSGMDAIKFDMKGDEEVYRKYCGADVDVVWRNIREAKRLGLHVEVVSLIIPEVNDSDHCIEGIIHKHLKEAGESSPLHFTRFYPSYKMTDRHATPVEALERAHTIAKREGVQYAYIGNVPGHRLENTYCPTCGTLIIERYGFEVRKYGLGEDRSCPKCGRKTPIVDKHI